MEGVVPVFDEWSTVLVIIALVSFIKIFMDATSKWTKSITELNVTVEQLTKCVEEFKSSNNLSHEKIFKDLDEHDDKLNEHDKRITVLEEKEKKA